MADMNLQLRFETEKGTISRMTLNRPKADLSPEVVRSVMDDIIADDVFTPQGGTYVKSLGADYITREVKPIFSDTDQA